MSMDIFRLLGHFIFRFFFSVFMILVAVLFFFIDDGSAIAIGQFEQYPFVLVCVATCHGRV